VAVASEESYQGFVVEWFRPDEQPFLLRVWIFALVLVVIGLFVMAVNYMPGLVANPVVRGLSLVSGLFMIFAGLGTAVRSAISTLADDVYLLLRGDGVLIHDPPEEDIFISWRALDRADVDDDGAVVLLRDDGHEPTVLRGRYRDIEPEALAERINSTQRRALMGLLRPAGRRA